MRNDPLKFSVPDLRWPDTTGSYVLTEDPEPRFPCWRRIFTLPMSRESMREHPDVWQEMYMDFDVELEGRSVGKACTLRVVADRQVEFGHSLILTARGMWWLVPNELPPLDVCTDTDFRLACNLAFGGQFAKAASMRQSQNGRLGEHDSWAVFQEHEDGRTDLVLRESPASYSYLMRFMWHHDSVYGTDGLDDPDKILLRRSDRHGRGLNGTHGDSPPSIHPT